ncbi:hypothetical protein [Alienimonas californiensis]|uniref:Uncharacterized protein n=1 Tax=Alienimonas californiensis TaxID=2527989 RepID=A0A517PD97_9PLAN|nr:hypothetical protein [Alienimonas californiensis]QDT17352.1 hypothetical protein CA12_34730 [Alienimonas californiensis]
MLRRKGHVATPRRTVVLNFLAHALPLLGEGDTLQPLRVVGAGAPDLLSVADRKVRLRERLLLPGDDPRLSAFCEGVRRHLHDDGWFHATRGFAEVTAHLGVTLRETFGPGDGFRSGFLGHIGTEMLLDDVLRERVPGCLSRYYEAVNAVDPEEVEAFVNRLHPQGTDRLAKLVRGFRDSRFLEDYADPARLLFRMNQVCKRVGLTPLPEAATAVLAEARTLVDRRRFDLLPPDRYAWPPETFGR